MDNHEVEILLVEDDPFDADLTIRALKKMNLANRLVHLSDGVAALEFIFGTGQYRRRDPGNVPNVILLDIKMPKLSGLEVLQKIKSDERTKLIPTVIVTSSSNDPDIQRAYALGANSYIVKPIEFENFSKTVSELGLYWMVIDKT
jgi:two-component system response regulator